MSVVDAEGRTEEAPGVAGRYRTLGRPIVALLAVGTLLTALASVSLWSWRTFANSDGFADVATDTLKEPAVAEALADQIVDILAGQAATAQAAVAIRPVLRTVVAEVVRTEAFRGIFHAGIRELHAAVFAGHRTRLLVRVDDAAQLVKDALRLVNPGVANAIPDSALQVAVGVSQSTPADLFMRGADLAGWLILPFAVGAATCFLMAVRRGPARRRTLEVAGLCLVSVGVVTFAVLGALVNVAADVGQDPRQRTALRAVFWSTMHVLNVTAKILLVLGVVIALAAALVGQGPLQRRLADLNAAGRRTLERPLAKLLASVVAMAAGVIALLWPAATAKVLVRGAAIGLLTVGLVGVFDLVGASRWVANVPSASRFTPRRLAVNGMTCTALFSLVLLFGGMSFVRAVRAPSLDRLGIKDVGCNGYRELCDRRVDEVAFAGTHNAMSATGEGWFFARQKGGIAAQLARGVRAFLIDLHYGTRLKEVVRTDFLTEADKKLTDAQVTPAERAALASALALAGSAPPVEDRKVYLCHLYCELGSTPARSEFQLLHDFLRVNPNEVVILILEDHVSAADAVAVLTSSGLADRAYTWLPGTPAPTLRQLIEHKKNVLIFVEHEGGTVPWYMPAYSGFVQDTPYKFPAITGLDAPSSCDLGRGRNDAPLLLLNHWLDQGVADPGLAAQVNSEKVLEKRADTCRKRRGQLPNILAVDFYGEGDLFRVVDHLNGVDLAPNIIASPID